MAVTIQHRHLQLNIKQTMHPNRIEEDVRRAFALQPDTIVFNECIDVTHRAIRRHVAERGHYSAFIAPSSSASQVVLVWDDHKYELVFVRVKMAMRGRKRVSPHRYVVRARLRHRESRQLGMLVGTHMVSSGWTGSTWLDAWRQKGWNLHYAVMAGILQGAARRHDWLIWSGDCNRPPRTFNGPPFAAYRVKGAATSEVVVTDGTHGRLIFDYVGLISMRLRMRLVRVTTPGFNSDHDGVLVDAEWPAETPPPPAGTRGLVARIVGQKTTV